MAPVGTRGVPEPVQNKAESGVGEKKKKLILSSSRHINLWLSGNEKGSRNWLSLGWGVFVSWFRQFGTPQCHLGKRLGGYASVEEKEQSAQTIFKHPPL